MPRSDITFFDEETAADQGGMKQARRRGNRRALVALLIGTLVLILAVAGVIGFYSSRINSALDNFGQDHLLPAPYAGQPQGSSSGAMNFLIVGADKNDNGSDGRSDVLMIAHLSGDRKQIYLVSFPRDMWVNVPANDVVQRDSMAKINAAYSWGRSPLAVKTVEQLTGVRIDNTAEVNFGGFVELTDTLGGVTVDNKVASTVGQHNYPQGEITIRGEEALTYVRQRHGLPSGDLDRAERQRAVLKAILDKAMSPEVLSNPITFGEMLDLASEQVTVDQTLPSSEVRRLIYEMGIRERGQVQSLQAPIHGFDRSRDGQSIAMVNEPQLAELSQALREDTMADYLAKYPKG